MIKRYTNLSFAKYILRILSVRPSLQNPPQSGTELVTYWESLGVINSRPEIVDRQEYARRLRHEAQTRDRA